MDAIQFVLLYVIGVIVTVISIRLIMKFWEQVKIFLACVIATVAMLAMLWFVPLL